MTAALLRHWALLMTGRHNGRGLPSEPVFVCLLIAAAAAVAFLRWGTFGAGFGLLVVFALVGVVDRRLASGLALVSVGVDGLAFAGANPDVLYAAELGLYASLAVRRVTGGDAS